MTVHSQITYELSLKVNQTQNGECEILKGDLSRAISEFIEHVKVFFGELVCYFICSKIVFKKRFVQFKRLFI